MPICTLNACIQTTFPGKKYASIKMKQRIVSSWLTFFAYRLKSVISAVNVYNNCNTEKHCSVFQAEASLFIGKKMP
jgi:hypothetical protein